MMDDVKTCPCPQCRYLRDYGWRADPVKSFWFGILTCLFGITVLGVWILFWLGSV